MEQQKKDFYEVLGVERTCSMEDLKKAYKKLAFETHPDRNNGDPVAEAKFKAVGEAYGVLSNPDRRRAYDVTGMDGVSGNAQHPNGPGFDPMEMFRNSFFRNFQQQHGPMGGGFQTVMSGVVGVLDLTLQEVLQGGEKSINVRFETECKGCGGTTVDMNAKPEGVCGNCNGTGAMRQQTPHGFLLTPCEHCKSMGNVYPSCKTCNGAGTATVDTTTNIKFPEGLRPGVTIHVNVQGAQVPVAVTVAVPAGVELGPQGRVTQDLPVDYPLLVTGGFATVTLLDGSKRRIKLPAAFAGRTVRLAGQGLPTAPRRPERGDLYFSVKVKMPSQAVLDSQEHKELIDKLQKMYNPDSSDEKPATEQQ